ncbi:Uncharacterized protein Fot_09575 [Forsythia ovata]|uniref:Uncharacterized protein n=1 Tax=Forsythia ovata TaxID=205694 RepID=A0ABD1WI52_9LAMI
MTEPIAREKVQLTDLNPMKFNKGFDAENQEAAWMRPRMPPIINAEDTDGMPAHVDYRLTHVCLPARQLSLNPWMGTWAAEKPIHIGFSVSLQQNNDINLRRSKRKAYESTNQSKMKKKSKNLVDEDVKERQYVRNLSNRHRSFTPGFGVHYDGDFGHEFLGKGVVE